MTSSLTHVIVAATLALAGAATTASAQTKCSNDCGVVQSVNFVEEKGKGTGLGMVAGGVVGGVIGHQIGSGRGNTVATVAGAAGGAYVGNEVEKKKNTTGHWAVAIKMDAGNVRTFTYSNQPTVQAKDRVKLVDGGKRLALVAN
jgi:outer membrane lipoprotein SlyB